MFERPPLDEPWWVDELPPDDPWTDADALGVAASGPVGVSHLANLLRIDAAALTPNEAVTFAEEVDRLVAFAAGLQAEARSRVAQRLIGAARATAAAEKSPFTTPEMIASAELAAALRVSPRSMDAQLDLVADLSGLMTPLRDALLRGDISQGHVWAIARELRRVPVCADVEQVDALAEIYEGILAVVVPYARSHTARQCARRTRMLVVAAVPVNAAERRREAAERDHGVWLTATEDGSCELMAVLPLAHGQAVFDAVSTLARSEKFETGEGCVSAGQRRVAALTTLVLGDPKGSVESNQAVVEAKVNARVNVVVPIATLIEPSISAQGGSIGGEPVSADVLLDVIAEAGAASTLRRLVTDIDGSIVDAGRTRYAISDTQRHLITLRDSTCRFPGCSRVAARCEIDHAIAWDDGGGTDLDNLGSLCKHHHQLKTFGGWRITSSNRAGECSWRSPLGRVYEHRPPPIAPPPSPVQEPVHGPPEF